MCCIGLACAVMMSLTWTFSTKLYTYQTLVLSVLLYTSDMWDTGKWTLLVAVVRSRKAFHWKCIRQRLRIHWCEWIRNSNRDQSSAVTMDWPFFAVWSSVSWHTCLGSCPSLVNKTLHLHHSTSLSQPPDRSCLYPPGYLQNEWLDQLRYNCNQTIGDFWRRTVCYRHNCAAVWLPAKWQWWWYDELTSVSK